MFDLPQLQKICVPSPSIEKWILYLVEFETLPGYIHVEDLHAMTRHDDRWFYRGRKCMGASEETESSTCHLYWGGRVSDLWDLGQIMFSNLFRHICYVFENTGGPRATRSY